MRGSYGMNSLYTKVYKYRVKTYITIRIIKWLGLKELGQWLRALVTLAEVAGLIPCLHTAVHNHLKLLPGESDVLF